MKRIVKQLLSICLVLGLLLSYSNSALAVSIADDGEYHFGSLSFCVEYSESNGSITEKITISENGIEPIIVEKVVFTDGSMDVYQDGVKLHTLNGADYESFMLAREGFTSEEQISGYANYACGNNAEHNYVAYNEYSVDTAQYTLVSSLAAAIIGYSLSAGTSLLLAGATAAAQFVFDNGIDYIEVEETKYFVHGLYANDLNCYHVHFSYYDSTKNGLEFHSSEWKYMSELI